MLSSDLIGKIAAGEVVERPANAIKELVENSLDAGAKHVTVEIEGGGTVSFRVNDDGCGIDERDIRMAFQRHATSKISSLEDLDAIGTLGFRGEALASVAAVSRVTMTTRTRNTETGIRVKNEGGQIIDIQEAACAPGTSILVKDIFYNVPVRRQFLKKPATEANAVTEFMSRLTLSRPDVGFRYLSDGRTIIHSSGDGKIESAILAIYGSQAVRTMRRVEGHENGILLRGYVGIGENARNNRNGENFFINGRMLRSPLLSGALEDACRERIMIGKFPLCVLYLEMPAANLNVNVHPNKMEVRFRFDQAVREAVFGLVYDALQDRDAFERPVEMPLTMPPADDGMPEVLHSDRPSVSDSSRNASVETGGAVPGIMMRELPEPVYRPIEQKTSSAQSYSADQLEKEAPILPPPLTRSAAAELSKASFFSPVMAGKSAIVSEKTDKSEELEQAWNDKPDRAMEAGDQLSALPADLPKPMHIFGALFNTFILIEYEDHLLMVDQHAVHERLLFDRMMRASSEHRAGQQLLVPYIISVSPQEWQILEENRDLLENLGLCVDQFSQTEVAVRSVPIILGQAETSMFIREAIEELERGKIPGEDKKRAAILQAACKHAVKGGERLSEDILRSLVEEMIDKKVTPTCPHGRPLVVSISHTELDKKFKRIQS